MKSKYKHVYFKKQTPSGISFTWLAYVGRVNKLKDTKHIIRKLFKTEIEAAKAVDLALIRKTYV